ncbi:hypothetical protein JOD55_001652 [Arcanobacterium pluranimalium]|uniref:hypothetical protein n=1 Tax=Arcanobacterium pluranimalium TaxID=108028 RepID=UPI0019589714|nr:hypothetical protein [Arcanobacterium pluranimalium]MBM7825825.1 hypothetical protein [Arcanobacterium pluranimalium]
MAKKRSIALVFTGALLLSACTSQAQPPAPSSVKVAETVVANETFNKIAAEVKKNIAEADAATDANKLGGRVSDPIRQYRDAHYRLKRVLGDAYKIPPIVIDDKAVPVASGAAFPRTVMTVAPANNVQNLPSLTIWTQVNARAQYQLWGQVQIFPDIQAPKLKASLTNQTGKLTDDPKKYAADPNTLINAYVEYNKSRQLTSVPFSAGDPLFSQISKQQDKLAQTIADNGMVQTNFAAGSHGIQAVATEDGGLLVVNELAYSVYVSKTKAGATLKLHREIGAMFSQDANNAVVDVDKPVTAQYSVLVAFYVPPQNAEDKTVKVLGASVPTLLAVSKEG